MSMRIYLLDIGGEGRHTEAINVNPSPTKTLGPNKVEPIPNHLFGRADSIPLPGDSVAAIIMGRTPPKRTAIKEILRVVHSSGTITLRHHVSIHHDPHRIARQRIPGLTTSGRASLGNQKLIETALLLSPAQSNRIAPSSQIET